MPLETTKLLVYINHLCLSVRMSVSSERQVSSAGRALAYQSATSFQKSAGNFLSKESLLKANTANKVSDSGAVDKHKTR